MCNVFLVPVPGKFCQENELKKCWKPYRLIMHTCKINPRFPLDPKLLVLWIFSLHGKWTTKGSESDFVRVQEVGMFGLSNYNAKIPWTPKLHPIEEELGNKVLHVMTSCKLNNISNFQESNLTITRKRVQGSMKALSFFFLVANSLINLDIVNSFLWFIGNIQNKPPDEIRPGKRAGKCFFFFNGGRGRFHIG